MFIHRIFLQVIWLTRYLTVDTDAKAITFTDSPTAGQKGGDCDKLTASPDLSNWKQEKSPASLAEDTYAATSD